MAANKPDERGEQASRRGTGAMAARERHALVRNHLGAHAGRLARRRHIAGADTGLRVARAGPPDAPSFTRANQACWRGVPPTCRRAASAVHPNARARRAAPLAPTSAMAEGLPPILSVRAEQSCRAARRRHPAVPQTRAVGRGARALAVGLRGAAAGGVRPARPSGARSGCRTGVRSIPDCRSSAAGRARRRALTTPGQPRGLGRACHRAVHTSS